MVTSIFFYYVCIRIFTLFFFADYLCYVVINNKRHNKRNLIWFKFHFCYY